jgi:CIC family chloride channel protein
MQYVPSKRFLSRFALRENAPLLISLVVGLFTALAVYLFRAGIEFFHEVLVVQLGQHIIGAGLVGLGIHPGLAAVAVLALAGLCVGFIMHRLVGQEKYHGGAGVIESVAVSGGRLPYWRMPYKGFASALSIGAGASVGAEDPSVQIGSNIGSFLGQKLHLGEEHIRLLVTAGAASAISAAFNAPIAGVFFALELILGEFTSRAFGVVVLSSVISSGVTRALRGENPIFAGIAPFTLDSPLHLVFYALLGVGLGLAASLALRFLFWQFHQLHHIRLPRMQKTALAGVCVGLVGVPFPMILGSGEAFMHDLLTGHVELAAGTLLLVAVVKLVVTGISYEGGFVGGVFAPSLFIGAVVGSAYGQALTPLLGAGSVQSFAVAGMAGMLAGFMRIPMTAVMIVFEITGDYGVILPVMLTAVTCTFLADWIGPQGFYTLNLLRHGIHLRQGRDIDLMQTMTVREAMQSPAPTIAHDATLVALRDTFRAQHARALCVLDDAGEFCGIVTLGDLQQAFEKALSAPGIQPGTLRVSDICTRQVITTAPHETLWTVIRQMGQHDIGRLPVINPANGQLMGILRRQDIMEAYNVAMARRLQKQHIAQQARLQTLTGVHVLEYHIGPQCPLRERAICDLGLPAESIIASIQRKGKLVVPHGSTRLLQGDLVTIVADPQAELILNEMFRAR